MAVKFGLFKRYSATFHSNQPRELISVFPTLAEAEKAKDTKEQKEYEEASNAEKGYYSNGGSYSFWIDSIEVE